MLLVGNGWEAGEQVFLNYGNFSDEEFLTRYGFVPFIDAGGHVDGNHGDDDREYDDEDEDEDEDEDTDEDDSGWVAVGGAALDLGSGRPRVDSITMAVGALLSPSCLVLVWPDCMRAAIREAAEASVVAVGAAGDCGTVPLVTEAAGLKELEVELGARLRRYPTSLAQDVEAAATQSSGGGGGAAVVQQLPWPVQSILHLLVREKQLLRRCIASLRQRSLELLVSGFGSR